MEAIKLLAADDEAIVLAFIKTLLAREKAPVSEFLQASNGREAVRLALEHKPDLVLLDIRMPGLDGLQAASAIIHALPRTMVIMVTAHDDFEYARAAFRSGVQDYLLKPLRADKVLACIRSALERKKALAQENMSGPTRRQTSVTQTVSEGSWPAPVRAAAEYVRAHIAEKLDLPLIARAVFVSPSHLSRLFARHGGQPLMAFVRTARLERARELLRNSTLSVSEIAEAVGFSSLSYFSQAFRADSGLSPQEFRKERDITTHEGKSQEH